MWKEWSVLAGLWQNDAATDTTDPPPLSRAQSAGGTTKGPEAIGRAASPLVLPLPRSEAFPLASDVARGMPNWTIGWVDEAAGLVVATATTRLFHFVDDVVIRVRPLATGTRIDVRSASRTGRCDLGTNRRRVRAYLTRLADAAARL